MCQSNLSSLKPQNKNLHIRSFDADGEVSTFHVEEGSHRCQFNLKTGQHCNVENILLFVQLGATISECCTFVWVLTRNAGGLTVFFHLKLCRKALLWVALEACHHLPQSRTTHTHTHTINESYTSIFIS